MTNVTTIESRGYAIEHLDGTGFWRPLASSTIETGFRMQPARFATRDAADAHVRKLIRVGWRLEQLRIVFAAWPEG